MPGLRTCWGLPRSITALQHTRRHGPSSCYRGGSTLQTLGTTNFPLEGSRTFEQLASYLIGNAVFDSSGYICLLGFYMVQFPHDPIARTYSPDNQDHRTWNLGRRSSHISSRARGYLNWTPSDLGLVPGCTNGIDDSGEGATKSDS